MKKIKNIYKEYYNNIYPSSDIDKKHLIKQYIKNQII